jgi:adenosylhomocysteine nucleosidase
MDARQCRLRWVGIVTGLQQEAVIARTLGRSRAGGGRPEGAAAAAAALADAGAAALISFGLAGGLDPQLSPGTLLVPDLVLHDERRFAADAGLAAQLGRGVTAPLFGGRHVVAACGEKRTLHMATGAAAIDLESGVVAEVAAARGLPFAALRAVCDPAARSLPDAALLALEQDGAISTWRVLASVARHPGQLAQLLALARDAARARASLVRRVREIARNGGLLVA